MILAESTTNLMQRLAGLPTAPYVGLLLRRKPVPPSLSHKTPPLRNDLNQMVLQRPVETARDCGLEFDAALGEDAFLVGVLDFAHLGDGVGEFDEQRVGV